MRFLGDGEGGGGGGRREGRAVQYLKAVAQAWPRGTREGVTSTCPIKAILSSNSAVHDNEDDDDTSIYVARPSHLVYAAAAELLFCVFVVR